MDKLFIIDGNSLVFRAFYGLPPLYNSQGTPCGAVFGFVKMLINIISKNNPQYLAVAFDAGKHNFRHEIFADYKGTRKATPDELRSQLPIVKDILKQMNITTIEIPEIEADDIIGSLSKQYDIDKVLISGDRDLLQLINPHCRVWLTQKGLTDIVDLDESALKEKYGVEPYQIIEMKSIMGDTSDNIPGVKGVGEKTALKLIDQYQNLDNIYANIDNITGKLQSLLIDQKDMAYISRRLATIKTNCEIDCKLEDLKYDYPFSQEVRKTFETLEFDSLVKKDEYFITDTTTPVECSYNHVELVSVEEKINALKGLLKCKEVGVHFYDQGMCFACGEEEWNFLNLELSNQDIYSLIKQVLENNNIEKIVFDAKSLMHKLSEYDVEFNNFYDVSLAYYLLESNEKEMNVKTLIDKNGLSLEFIAISLIKLKQNSLTRLKEMGMQDLYYKIELQLVKVLYSMERAGIKVDKDAIKQLGEKYGEEQKAITSQIYELVGQEFNINSPKQMQEILFDKLKLQYKGKKGTGVEVLEAIQDQHPVIEKILRYRKVAKICSTYLEGLLPYIKDGKIHTTFLQTATATGRLSSREPNLQNIPVRDEEGKELRKLFTSSFEGGVIVSADYSQIELRLLAHFSNDSNLVQCFNDGQDVHTSTASRVFGVQLEEVTSKMRSMAKSVNFGIIYGISEYGLSRNIHLTPKEAKEFIAKYFDLYPTIKSYMDNNIVKAKEKGYISTLLGRVRYIPEINSSNYPLRQFGERVAMNMPLQGTASDIIKMAMINVQNRINEKGLKSKLILQIHDELIVDTHMDEIDIISRILKEEMENVIKLNIPLIVSVSQGRSWFDAK